MPARNQSTEKIGETHGRLTVIAKAGRTQDRKTLVSCQCECGSQIVATLRNLRNGNTKSCGCLANESRAKTSKSNAIHGMYNTAEYHAWEAMIQRCRNPAVKSWKNYGGRGITVCDRWSDFVNFYADMGARPIGCSLDRIDNEGPYTPDNCRWATWETQNRNTRASVFVTINGEKAHIIEWAERYNISIWTIRHRLRAGWEPEKAVTTASLRKRREAHKS